ncbi:MAG: hypothetical protein JSS78_11960 [Bacteroidetes bacterium]|nr:hypothetical protein [Bacteroidota bacterium]
MTNEVGSWWIYGGSDSSVSRRIATGRDSTVKGFFFSYYERKDTTSATGYITPEFYGKNKNSYVTLIDMDGSMTSYITVIFFKDSVGIGEEWSNQDKYAYQIFNFDIKINSKIVDTGGVMTINGHTYTGIYHTLNSVQGKLTFSTDYSDLGTIKVWFVKGIGIIKQDMNISIAGVYSKIYRDSLLAYHLVQ